MRMSFLITTFRIMLLGYHDAGSVALGVLIPCDAGRTNVHVPPPSAIKCSSALEDDCKYLKYNVK